MPIIYEPLTLHWYDAQSFEGIFKTNQGESIFCNFELEPESHEIARNLKQGDEVLARIISDSTFCQISRIQQAS